MGAKMAKMDLAKAKRIIFLASGDVLAFYFSLFIALFLRYGSEFNYLIYKEHLIPFSLIYILWLGIFYINGLYELSYLRNNLTFLKRNITSLLINVAIAAAVFYFIPIFGIAPKTNLFLVAVVFGFLELWWRTNYNRLIVKAKPIKIIIWGEGYNIPETIKKIKNNPQFGYQLIRWIKNYDKTNLSEIKELIQKEKVESIIVSHNLKTNQSLKAGYYLIELGIEVKDFASFYESIFNKIPLADIDELWFIEKEISRTRFYDKVKRLFSLVAASVLFIILFPLMLLISILIKLTSAGPVIYAQQRVGRDRKIFWLYKFRTMYKDAEKEGARWASPGDKRVTPIGKILRYSHLDELPQLINIIKGELSFVGPRPERPEFVEILERKVPYYNVRHLINPGVTGWAQINYKYGASIEDAYQKLEYDLYYLKNRSFILDIAIVIKTIKLIFINPK